MQALVNDLLASLRAPADTASSSSSTADAVVVVPAASAVDSPLVAQLVAHGFSAATARTALTVTGSEDLNELLDFILAHDFSQTEAVGAPSVTATASVPASVPASASSERQETLAVDDSAVSPFTRFGFSSEEVAAALVPNDDGQQTVTALQRLLVPFATVADADTPFDVERCASDRCDELLALVSIFGDDAVDGGPPARIELRDENASAIGELFVWLPPSYPDAGFAVVAWQQSVDMRRPLPLAQVRELNGRLQAKSVELSATRAPYLFELTSWLKDEIVVLRSALPASPKPTKRKAQAAEAAAAPAAPSRPPRKPAVDFRAPKKPDADVLAKAAAIERTRQRLDAQRALEEQEARRRAERDAFLLQKIQRDAELERMGIDPIEDQRRRDRELAEQLAALAAPPPPTAAALQFEAAVQTFSIGEVAPDAKIDAENSAALLISNARFKRFLKMKAAQFRHDVSGIDLPTVAAPEGSRFASMIAARQNRAESAGAPLPASAQPDVAAVPDAPLQAMLTHKPVFDAPKPPTEEQRRATERASQRLLRDYERRERGQFSSPQSQAAAQQRRQLPAFLMRDEIVQACLASRVVVIAASTGAGKTTQVGQFILDHYIGLGIGGECSIICTQPRRLAAISVAERVAVERDEACGETVGYSIRLESKMSKATRLLFCTTGVLLRRLQSDEALSSISHVILDEVHERTIESDLLLTILRDLLRRRADLRVILMSATVNAKLFANYFSPVVEAPIVIEVPGRTFEVAVLHLETIVDEVGYIIEQDSEFAVRAPRGPRGGGGGGGGGNSKRGTQELVKATTDEMTRLRELQQLFPDVNATTIRTLALMDPEKINYELLEEVVWRVVAGVFDAHLPAPTEGERADAGGAILVFLPGMAEITELHDLLSNDADGRAAQIGVKVRVLALHSELSSDDQRLVFERPPPGVVKICISTNIAEMSLTIDDISYVIDCGKHKELRFDTATEIETLDTTVISQANAMQRRGRAGRVRRGLCLRMFTSDEHRRLARYPLPEVHRCDLEQLFLQVLLLELGGVREFVATMIEPPHANMVNVTTRRLTQLGAMDHDMQLTPLGFHVASLPLEARLAKALLMGSVLACVEPVAIIAACLTHRSPFMAPFDKRDAADAARRSFSAKLGGERSDHLTLLEAYKAWRREASSGNAKSREYKWCHTNFLSINTLRMIEATKNQFLRLLVSVRFCRLDAKGNVAHEFNENSDQPRMVLAALTAGLYPNVARMDLSAESPTQQLTTNVGAAVLHPTSVVSGRGFASPWLVFFAKLKTRQVYIRDASMIDSLLLLLFSSGHVHVQANKNTIVVDQWIKFRAPPSVGALVRELRLAIEGVLLDKIRNPTATQTTKLNRVVRTLLEEGQTKSE